MAGMGAFLIVAVARSCSTNFSGKLHDPPARLAHRHQRPGHLEMEPRGVRRYAKGGLAAANCTCSIWDCLLRNNKNITCKQPIIRLTEVNRSQPLPTVAGVRSLIDGAPICCIAARVSERMISSTRSTPGCPQAP